MQRICDCSTGQSSEIGENKKLQAICAIQAEINNYKELVKELPPEHEIYKGDLDLAIRFYRNYGTETIKKFNGLFSLALLDVRDSSCILINDRFGLAHQVYWLMMGSRFYFATHLKSILALSEIRKEIDPEGLNLFLKFSYIPSLDRARQVVQLVLEGVPGSPVVPPAPVGVRFRDVRIANTGVAWIDLEGATVGGLGSDHEQALIGALARSLTEAFPEEVQSVGILIDGEPRPTINGHVDLSRTYTGREWPLQQP